MGLGVTTRLGAEIAACTAVAVLALAASLPSEAAAAPDSHYGVTAGSAVNQSNFDEALARASAAGVGSIRVNCEWTYVMKPNHLGQMTYYWGGCDRVIDRVRAAGLEPLMFSFYSHADYCTTAPASVTSVPMRQRYPPCNGDRGFPEYREFIRQMVSRYGPNANGYGAGYGRNQISHWEIGNEPNHSGYFPDSASDPAKAAREYAKILDAAHDAAKAADPTATVLLGGLATGATGSNRYDSSFVSRIIDDPIHPAAENFDVLNFHTYEDHDRATHHLNSLRSQLGGNEKPSWVTEISYPSDPALQQEKTFSSNYPLGEAGQAAYLRRVLSSLRSQGVDRVFWNSLTDSVHDRSAYCSNSLTFTSGSICPSTPPTELGELRAKAAFQAYADLIAQGFDSEPSSPPASPTSLTAKAGTGRVSVDWSDVSEPALAGYRVYRRVGGGAWSPIATTRSSDYADVNVTIGTSYSYRVTAFDGGSQADESSPSNEAQATPTVNAYRPAGYRRLVSGPVYPNRGALSRLNEDDASRFELTSVKTGAGTYVSDFYTHASISPGERAAVRKVSATYDGNASASSAALSLYVYNLPRHRWVRVDGPRTRVTADRGFGWSTLSPRDYVSEAGEIRFRVRGSSPSGFRTRTDRVRFRLDR